MIKDSKIKHSLTVARVCREDAKRLGMTHCMQDAAFVMGLLHDIGYEDVNNDNPSEVELHPLISRNMIRGFLDYIDSALKAIETHGACEDLSDPYALILNHADLVVGPDGEVIGMEKRIEDVIARYGKDEKRAKNAIRQKESVEENEDYQKRLKGKSFDFTEKK